MLGKIVTCNVQSAFENRKVVGQIIRLSPNRGIYEIRLAHNITFKGSRLGYSVGDTMLISKNEIQKS